MFFHFHKITVCFRQGINLCGLRIFGINCYCLPFLHLYCFSLSAPVCVHDIKECPTLLRDEVVIFLCYEATAATPTV